MMYADKQQAFKQWVAEHSDVLYSYSVNHGFDEEGAKDMVQETFLSAWRNMEGYKGVASVRNWLFVILKSRIADHFRKAANKAAVDSIQQAHGSKDFFDEEDHWRQGVYPRDWQVNASDPLEAKDFHKIFRGCSGKLKRLQNTVFVMKYVDEMDSEEICKELGITSSNYWVILHRAKVQLRACLEQNWLSK